MANKDEKKDERTAARMVGPGTEGLETVSEDMHSPRVWFPAVGNQGMEAERVPAVRRVHVA